MKNHGIIGLLALTILLLTSCASNELAEKTVGQKKAEIYYTQGTDELIKKNYPQALINLLKAKDYDPKDALIRNNLGMAYYFREQPKLAEQEFLASINLDNKNSDAKVNLGSLYLENNRIKEARELFEAVTLDLTYQAQFRNYYNLAVLSLKIGDRGSAFDFLDKALKENDSYCQGHYKLGELYFEENRFEKALKSFKEAGKGICVNEASPIYQQALALISLNRNEEAKNKLKIILDKFQKTPFFNMANAQLRKINSTPNESVISNNYKTEIIKESKTVPSPNF